jgi:hypothetical protein
MQPIQKFSDFQNKRAESAQAVKEADLQKEYGEVFTSLLKKYGVSSPAELDDAKKKEFFNEIGDFYKAGEGQTDKGEDLVDKEGGEAPVKEEDESTEDDEEKEKEEAPAEEAPKEEAPAEEAPKEEAPAEEAPKEETPAEEAPKAEDDEEKKEEVEEAETKGTEIKKAPEEDTEDEVEKEIVDMGEPETAGGEVPKQEEPVTPAADTHDDPEAGKAAEAVPDEETAKEIEKEKVETGKPEKVVMDFDSFVKSNFAPKG